MTRLRLAVRLLARGVSAYALALGIVAFSPTSSGAGEYHFEATLVCYDCHTLHCTLSRGYSGEPVTTGSGRPDGAWVGSTVPNAYLLKATGSWLCLACHDGQTFAPDVMGENTGTHARSAGAVTTGAAPYEDWKGHSINLSATPPGGAVSMRLQCVNCHERHGSQYFRNLPNTVAQVTYAKQTNDTTKDVFLRGWALGDIANNYKVENVDFNEPDQKKSAMSQFCQGCHTVFHGSAGDSEMGGAGGTSWLRHPTADADIGAQGGGHSTLSQFTSALTRVRVTSGSGVWGTPGVPWIGAPSNLTPNCLTCHKAHGNQNPFGLIFLSRFATSVTEEGGYAAGQTPDVATGLRNLCGQCHQQGN